MNPIDTPRLFRADGSPVTSVAIIGMGPSMQGFLTEIITQDRTEPIADEIWTINLASLAIRTDRVVWMDDLEEQNKNFAFSLWDIARLNVPVLTATAHPEIVPLSYAYPINDVAVLSLQYFGRVYLNNSVAYAIGYAHAMGVKSLKLYGCDFTYPNWNHAERGRACVESWLVAHVDRGGQVALPEGTSLFDQVHGNFLYGYAKQPDITLPNGAVLKYVELPNHEKRGAYVPQDTSGVTNAQPAADGPVSGAVSGAEGPAAGGDASEPLPGAAPEPDPASGEGVCDPGAGGGDGAGPAPVHGLRLRKGRVRPAEPEGQAGAGDGAGPAAGGMAG